MTEQTGPPHVAEAPITDRDEARAYEEPEPRGTLAILLLYIALLIAFWGWTFILLLQRG